MAGLLNGLVEGLNGAVTPLVGPLLTNPSPTGSPLVEAPQPDTPQAASDGPGVIQVSLPGLLPPSLPPILGAAPEATGAPAPGADTTTAGTGGAPTSAPLPSSSTGGAAPAVTSSAPPLTFLTTAAPVVETTTMSSLLPLATDARISLESTATSSAVNPENTTLSNTETVQQNGASMNPAENPTMMALIITIPIAAIILIGVTIVLYRGGCLRCGKRQKQLIIKDEIEHEAWKKVHQDKFGPSQNY